MRIDSHQHFWNYDPVRDRWINDAMSLLRRDYQPEHLLPELKANQFDGCIAVQADQSENETRFLLDLANRHAEIRGVVGWLDLCADNVNEVLQRYASCKKLRGLRHVVQSEPDDRFMVRDDFVHGISCLKEFGFTYDILIYAHQLPAAIELVSRFPDQAFVIDHIAKPQIRTKQQNPWAKHIRDIAANKNVYCKLSGLITEADWQHWSEEDIRPYLDVVFESFGTNRLMFGSDWPVCLLAGTYSCVVAVIHHYTDSLSMKEKLNIFGLNAVRFYGL